MYPSLFSYCGEGLGGVGGPQSAYSSSTEGPLCCFHFGVTLNKPSMNILCTGLCEHKPSFFFWDKWPRVGMFVFNGLIAI